MDSWTFCTNLPLARQQSAKQKHCCVVFKCMCALLCVKLPVALARLPPPPCWLCCAQADSSPTAAPACCLNMFWQRKHYHNSWRPSAARSWGAPDNLKGRWPGGSTGHFLKDLSNKSLLSQADWRSSIYIAEGKGCLYYYHVVWL